MQILNRSVLPIFFLSFFIFSLADAQEIKIGFMSPLTGVESGEAHNLTNALNLAVKEVNEGGGVRGNKIRIVTADTQSTPQAALEAYTHLIDQDDVIAVIAPFKSAQIVALLPKGIRSKIPTVVGGTAPRLTEEGDFIIRTRPDDRVAAAAMVKYIKQETKFKNIAILHDDGAFGTGGANLLTKYSSEVGLNIIKRVSFKIGEKKFAPYLKQIKESNAQIMIVYVANLEESANIIIEFAKLKSSMMYLGSPASQSNLALAKAKDSAEGITAIVDMFMGQTPASAKYHAAYKKEYGEEPDNIAPYVYDGIKLLARAISEVGPEKNKIRDAILKTKNYQGVMGTYRFNEKGDGLSTVGIVKIEHGKPKLVKTLNIQ